jgi:hypothetical protein
VWVKYTSPTVAYVGDAMNKNSNTFNLVISVGVAPVVAPTIDTGIDYSDWVVSLEDVVTGSH